MFDSGLIGEGVLHAVAAAHANLLQPDATLVLSSAVAVLYVVRVSLDCAYMSRADRACQHGFLKARLPVSWLPLRTNVRIPDLVTCLIPAEKTSPRYWVSVWVLQVPRAATIFCQPLQLRRTGAVVTAGAAGAIDASAANRWHWRPDYEGIELGLCRYDAATKELEVRVGPTQWQCCSRSTCWTAALHCHLCVRFVGMETALIHAFIVQL